MASEPVRRRFTVAQFEQMGHSGILAEDDRVELIAGEIIEMAAIGQRHAACVKLLVRLLVQFFGNAAIIGAQDPIVIGDDYEPQPDLMVLKPRDDFYAGGHPTPEDVLLLIEIADSSLRFDRRVKLPLYADAGIPETWLLDLNANRIERHSNPADGAYRVVRRFRPGQTIASATVPGLSFPVSTLLIV